MPKRQDRDPYVTDRKTPFTNKEMELMCGVTPMTLWLWRKGTPTKSKLATSKGRGREVRYPVAATMSWLRKHEVPVQVHPDDLGQAMTPSQFAIVAPTVHRKSGPKPKAAAPSERPSAR